MLSRFTRTSCSTRLRCSGPCSGLYSLWHARRADSRNISGRQRLIRAPFLRVAALFDEEDPEGELFAPYWGQQEVDWENPPEEDNGLGQVWYEVCTMSVISAQFRLQLTLCTTRLQLAGRCVPRGSGTKCSGCCSVSTASLGCGQHTVEAACCQLCIVCCSI